MKSDNMLIQWKFTYVFSFLLTVWFSSHDTAALSMKARGKRHTNPHSRQEHLIRNSRDYEVVYPVEVDERGVFANHVSSLTPSRRKRRSVGHEKGPFRYQLELAGDMFNMNLHLNEKLLGSDFAISTYKDDGTVETTRSYDNCFLIGESSASDYSVAINDCDGLAGMIKIGQRVYYIEPVLNHTLIKEKGFPPKPGRPHIVYKDTATLHGDTVDERSEEWWDLDKNQAAIKAKLSKLSEYKEAKSRKKRQAVYTSYIRFYNIARRTVKVYYMRNGKPKFFTRLGIQNYLNVNTYRGVTWIVLDEQSRKPMHLNMSSNFVSTKSSRYKRLQVYITIPMGEVFPEYIPPRRPDSRVAFKNPSARFVQIFYMDTDNNTHKFKVVWPFDSANVDTYTEHRWTAEDYDTYKPLLLNNKPHYYAKAQKGLNEVIVSVPEGTKFPVIKYPDIDKQPPKYIEVMATADESVVRYHGKKDVARYTLTLMNIVSLLFRHRSIGVNIYFVVVRLSILQKNPPGIKITRQPMKSLNSVCRWGHSVRKGQDKSHQAFYDQTVFLTRKSFGPSGYAPVFGMCNRLRSCTLNDDDGFGSSFIVAHETGHTVGMEHDGQRNNCSRDTIKGSIMAPLVRSRFDRYHWSSCSRNELLTNLPAFWCLNDKPFNNSIKYQKKLPGEYFNLDDQCKKQYGSGYKFCSKYARNPCRALWCIQRTNPRSYCRSRYTPALDGSSCGKNKWCRIGYCVEVSRGNKFVMPTPPPPPKPIHGGWGKWSLFGSCSADCGTGVRTRSRKCDSPSPKNNGKPCEGASDQSKLCFSKKCKDNMLSPDEIRDQQCKSRGPTITKLVKKWKRYDFSKVNMNCTFEKDLCSWRQSLGDNSDWKQISGRTPSAKTGPSFDHTLGKGKKGKYVYFETSRPVEKGWKARLESKMIGLKLSCLKFYFHSYGDFDHMGQLRLIVRFQNKEKTVWRTTQNYGDRWIPKEVTLVSEQHPFMIIFEAERGDGYLGDFAIDDISLRPGACKLQFRPSDAKNRIKLNPCNTYCEAADGNRNDIAMIKLKDGTRCYDYDNPHDICLRGSCIKFGCDNKMDSSKKTDECGVCGGTGSSCTIVKGTVKIVAEKEYEKVMQCPVGTTNIFFEESVKSSNFLSIQILEKNSRPSLNGDDRLWKPGRYRIAGTKFIYSIDEQGKESLKAIDAIQKPIIITVKRGAKPNAESTVTYKFSKPKSAITVEYNWTFGRWSYCSKTCGPGIQKRSYLCARKHDNLFVNERFCRFEKKPPAPVRKCERRPCVFLYKWILRKWRRCSKTCGGGYRYRSIRCIELWRNVTVGSSYCRKTMKVPLRRTSCNKQPCPSQWHAEKWGECSVTCGKGNRSRNVTCLDHKRTLSKKCNDTNKPPTTEECHLDECGNFTEKKQRIKGLSCSFENGFCKWSNVKGKDDFDFKLGSGRTPSDGTGPRADNTLKNRKGKYVYIEGSSPRRRGETAQLISPKLNVSSACISFFYHMFGYGIGRLSLYVKTSKKSYRLFFRYGNKGGFWNEAAVSVSTKQAFQIVFEAVRGRSFRSDICLDDIVVETGKCRRGSITTECTDNPSINCPGITQGGKSNWCTTRKYKIRCCESCKNNVLNKKTK